MQTLNKYAAIFCLLSSESLHFFKMQKPFFLFVMRVFSPNNKNAAAKRRLIADEAKCGRKSFKSGVARAGERASENLPN